MVAGQSCTKNTHLTHKKYTYNEHLSRGFVETIFRREAVLPGFLNERAVLKCVVNERTCSPMNGSFLIYKSFT